MTRTAIFWGTHKHMQASRKTPNRKPDLGNVTKSGLNKNQYHLLQSIKNASARLIFLARYHNHVTPLLKQLKWVFSSSWSYHLQNCQHHKVLPTAVDGHAPNYLSSEIIHTPDVPGCSHLHSTSSATLMVPCTIIKAGGRAFRAVTPKSWNKLPSDIITFHS